MINHSKVRPASGNETINMAIDAPVTLECSQQDGQVFHSEDRAPLFIALLKALEVFSDNNNAIIVDEENRLILNFTPDAIHCDQRIMRIIEKIGETG